MPKDRPEAAFAVLVSLSAISSVNSVLLSSSLSACSLRMLFKGVCETERERERERETEQKKESYIKVGDGCANDLF